MNISKDLKKVLICGASLVMIASLGSGINNVSAKRTHRYHYRTSRVYRHRTHRSKRARYLAQRKAQYKGLVHYLHWLNWYDGHHANKMNTWKARHLYYFMNKLTRHQKHYLMGRLAYINVSAPKYYRKHFVRHHAKHVKRHARYEKRNRHVARKHTVRRKAHKHYQITSAKSTPTVSEVASTPTISSGIASTSSASNSSAKPVSSSASNNVASHSNNVTSNNSSSDSSTDDDNPNYTDNGKIYTYDKLINLLNEGSAYLGITPESEQDKIIRTIHHYINIANDGSAEEKLIKNIASYYESSVSPIQYALGIAKQTYEAMRNTEENDKPITW